MTQRTYTYGQHGAERLLDRHARVVQQVVDVGLRAEQLPQPRDVVALDARLARRAASEPARQRTVRRRVRGGAVRGGCSGRPGRGCGVGRCGGRGAAEVGPDGGQLPTDCLELAFQRLVLPALRVERLLGGLAAGAEGRGEARHWEAVSGGQSGAVQTPTVRAQRRPTAPLGSARCRPAARGG